MINNIQNHLNKTMEEQNNHGLLDFEGYSPIEMKYILNNIFEKNCPVQLMNLTDSEYQSIPLLNQMKFIIELIGKKGELKLTNKGFLPTKIVSTIYKQGYLKEGPIESGIIKLYKETDSITINLTRILLELSGITKKRHNKLSLTKKGQIIKSNNHQLLLNIFKTFGLKFNWAYFDLYGENKIGQLGFGFSLILLHKYGNKKLVDKFYAQKYFQAFPNLINNINLTEFKYEFKKPDYCYSLRTFNRFLDYFCLIKIEQNNKLNAAKYITKTKLFDKLIKCLPHKMQSQT